MIKSVDNLSGIDFTIFLSNFMNFIINRLRYKTDKITITDKFINYVKLEKNRIIIYNMN